MLDDIPPESDPGLLESQDGPRNLAEEAAVHDQDATLPTRAPVQRPGSRPQWFRTPDATAGAGATYGKGKTAFELIRDEEILTGGTVLGPFRDDDEWQLAKWLIKHVGHTATDEFLKLSIYGQKKLTLIFLRNQIRDRANPSFENKNIFFDKVDGLPGGVKWHCKQLNTKGDLPDLDKDPTGVTMRREHNELWWRDPVECVRELLGNPTFRDAMRYAPEKLYSDQSESVEILNEMWTANWWWEIQVCRRSGGHGRHTDRIYQKRLPPGATVVPLILSSDKTMLSNFRGDNSAWPVYLTIGNIGKDTRRQVSAHATVLIGYLPIPKFDCFDKATRSLAKYRLFHQCMTVIMQSVIAAGTTGVPMVCADSMIRNVWHLRELLRCHVRA
ncbi:hypothetical protein B0H15DRAFT_785594 [Mycena belliarum]|uniref:Uncharacterized protein n=1 Tax=Mycena belliarum TaxID=1033014 RepID=A0AAD6TZ91_9AGAR|nr:hypothetical protein B0H15DRAFT_785594 [Mycena belliae]